LQPQEIRVALYHGAFAALLSKLNENGEWRTLYGRKSSRLKDIELILRFLGLYFHSGSYRKPMKGFLNRYMGANRDLSKQPESVIRPLFESTVSAILEGIGLRVFRPYGSSINAAVLESVMYGIASRLSAGPIEAPHALAAAYNVLLKSPTYIKAVSRSTADEESVSQRLAEAKATFISMP
jgi:hypothetical protein